MALEKEYMVVPFIGGMDEGKDSHVVTQPLLKSSINFESTKEGALRVRPDSIVTDTAGPGDPRLFRYKDGAFVVSESEYGSLDTERGSYERLGDLPVGFKSKSVGSNDSQHGGRLTRVCRGPGGRIARAFCSHDERGVWTTEIAIYDKSGTLLWRTSIGDTYLMDAHYMADVDRAAFAVRFEGAFASTEVRVYMVSFTSGSHVLSSYVLNNGFVDAEVSAAGGNALKPRQVQIQSIGDRIWGIVNYFHASLAETQWGSTMVFTVGPSMTSVYICSIGSLALVSKDGSAMVSCDLGRTATSTLFCMTCSVIDGLVRLWEFDTVTESFSPSSIVGDGLRGYGILAKSYLDPIGVPGPNRVQAAWTWYPGAAPDYGSPEPVIGTGVAQGDAFDTTQSFGHSFMYGFVYERGGDVLCGWHGMLQWAVARDFWEGEGLDFTTDIPRLLGCTFVKTSTEDFSLFTTVDAHNCHLLGKPTEGSELVFDVPVAVAAKWYGSYIDPDLDTGDEGAVAPTRGFSTLREQVGAYRKSDEGLQYSCGAMLRVDASDELQVLTTSLFGHDAVAPHTDTLPARGVQHLLHTGPYTDGLGSFLDNTRWEGDVANPRLALRESWRLYDIHTCGHFILDGTHYVGGTKWASIEIQNLYGGPRSFQGSDFSARVNEVTDWQSSAMGRPYGRSREYVPMIFELTRPTPLAIDAQEIVLVDTGVTCIFDGSTLHSLMWYVPPQPVLSRMGTFRGKSNAPNVKRMSVAACWFFVDAVGTKWRSAPSFEASYGLDRMVPFHSFAGTGPPGIVPSILASGDLYADVVPTVFSRTIPQPAELAARVGIEYYTTHSDQPTIDASSLNGDGPMSLFAWAPVSSGAYRTAVPETLGDGLRNVGLVDDLASAAQVNRLYVYAGLSIGWNLTPKSEPTQLIYTTGGVLEDEPPIGANYLTFAGGRVWYIRDGRAYFSKSISKGKPIGFNSNLFVDAPNGDELVAVSNLDENIVVFSRTGVFVCVGTGPNDLGSGPSYQAIPVASPVGCYNPASVLSTEVGIFFAGPRTLYLLRRDMNVVRIGNIEESLDVPLVRFAFQDRTENRFFWYVDDSEASGGHFVVFEAERGLWHKWVSPTETEVTSGLWTINGTYYAQDDGSIRRVDEAAPRFSASLTTGWIHLGQTIGYKRFRNGYLSVRTNAPSIVAVGHSYDYEDTPSESSQESISGADGTYLVRWKPARQKCASYAMSVQVAPSGANAQLSLTHLGMEVGAKALGHKIPRGAV